FNTRPMTKWFVDQGLIYKNGYPTLGSTIWDDDAADGPHLDYQARPGSYEEDEWKFAQQHNFTFDVTRGQYNKRGWREKYVYGFKNGIEVEYFFLPNGELYRFKNSIEESEFVLTFDMLYYYWLDVITFLTPDRASAWGPSGFKRVWTQGTDIYFEMDPQ